MYTSETGLVTPNFFSYFWPLSSQVLDLLSLIAAKLVWEVNLGCKVGQMLIYDGLVNIYTLEGVLINGNTSKICLPEEEDIGLHLILGQKVPTTLLYT